MRTFRKWTKSGLLFGKFSECLHSRTPLDGYTVLHSESEVFLAQLLWDLNLLPQEQLFVDVLQDSCHRILFCKVARCRSTTWQKIYSIKGVFLWIFATFSTKVFHSTPLSNVWVNELMETVKEIIKLCYMFSENFPKMAGFSLFFHQ